MAKVFLNASLALLTQQEVRSGEGGQGGGVKAENQVIKEYAQRNLALEIPKRKKNHRVKKNKKATKKKAGKVNDFTFRTKTSPEI